MSATGVDDPSIPKERVAAFHSLYEYCTFTATYLSPVVSLVSVAEILLMFCWVIISSPSNVNLMVARLVTSPSGAGVSLMSTSVA